MKEEKNEQEDYYVDDDEEEVPKVQSLQLKRCDNTFKLKFYYLISLVHLLSEIVVLISFKTKKLSK